RHLARNLLLCKLVPIRISITRCGHKTPCPPAIRTSGLAWHRKVLSPYIVFGLDLSIIAMKPSGSCTRSKPGAIQRRLWPWRGKGRRAARAHRQVGTPAVSVPSGQSDTGGVQRDAHPVLVAQGLKALSELCGQRTRTPGPDGAAVDAHHRDNFCACTGDEAFIGGVEIITREETFCRRLPEFLRHFQDAVAADALQGSSHRRRCAQLSLAHEEDVVGGAFGHV